MKEPPWQPCSTSEGSCACISAVCSSSRLLLCLNFNWHRSGQTTDGILLGIIIRNQPLPVSQSRGMEMSVLKRFVRMDACFLLEEIGESGTVSMFCRASPQQPNPTPTPKMAINRNYDGN